MSGGVIIAGWCKSCPLFKSALGPRFYDMVTRIPAAVVLFLASVTVASAVVTAALPQADAVYAPSPLEQIRAGTASEEVRCGSDKLVLAIRADSRPACVYPATADRMAGMHGWVVVVATTTETTTMTPIPDGYGRDPSEVQDGGMGDVSPEHGTPVQPRDVHPIPASVSEAGNMFTIGFYNKVASGNSDNHFLSPIGIFTAFSVLYEGAGGQSAEQLREVFGYVEDDIDRHNATTRMLSSINRDDPDAELSMANALWIADRYREGVSDEYVDTIRNVYLATVETTSFTDSADGSGGEIEGVKRINDWAAANTNGKIPKVVSPDLVDLHTVAIINNAIYFKGTWLYEFDEDNTRKSRFWTAGGGSVDAELMHQDARLSYAEFGGVQVIRLPYEGGRLSMLVALPMERDGLDALEADLSVDLVDEWGKKMYQTDVSVFIPKFEMRTNYDLVPPLREIGVSDVFSAESADLSEGIDLGTANNVYVSHAVHDAYVKINEEGTEAAAVTTIGTTIESMGPENPVFRADRPFLFMIQDNESDAILFIGSVSNPAQ